MLQVHELREHQRLFIGGHEDIMTCLKQSHLGQRLEIARFATVASFSEAIALERVGKGERADIARTKADRRLRLSRRLATELANHRSAHSC